MGGGWAQTKHEPTAYRRLLVRRLFERVVGSSKQKQLMKTVVGDRDSFEQGNGSFERPIQKSSGCLFHAT